MKDTVPNILVVDDDDVFVEVIERALVRANYHCDTDVALSLAEAVVCLGKREFDCILLDHQLGDGDAFSLIDKLASIPNSPAVIMLTNNEDVSIAIRAMKNGAADFINKGSMTPETLRQSIEKTLDARQAAEQAKEEVNTLHRMSFFDELTGLANRNLLTDRMEQTIKAAQRNNEIFTFFMMDLNLFKEVNDTYGHEAGDEVLRQTAARLTACLRGTDTVGRLGGDEFVAILEGTHSIEGAVVGAKKIIDEMTKPMIVNGVTLEVGMSIGIALYPANGTDGISLMKAADIAMYQAKRGTEDYSLAANHVAATDRAGSIASALQSDELLEQISLYYQPKVEFNSPRICGVEALARWRHPEFGLLKPVDFIPPLERTNAIKQVTYHTVEEAVEQQKKWISSGKQCPIAINISKRMLQESDFADQIGEIISSRKVPGNLFFFEFSEIGPLKNPILAAKLMWALSELGVKISMRNFGGGQTPFQCLKDFPVNEIKLDRTFLEDLANRRLNRSIIRSVAVLAEGIDCDVVAVGVESAEVWEQLIALGCTKGQGFYFAPPMPVADLEIWREQWAQSVDDMAVENQVLPALLQA